LVADRNRVGFVEPLNAASVVTFLDVTLQNSNHTSFYLKSLITEGQPHFLLP